MDDFSLTVAQLRQSLSHAPDDARVLVGHIDEDGDMVYLPIDMMLTDCALNTYMVCNRSGRDTTKGPRAAPITSTAVVHALGCTEPCSCGAWDRSTLPLPA